MFEATTFAYRTEGRSNCAYLTDYSRYVLQREGFYYSITYDTGIFPTLILY